MGALLAVLAGAGAHLLLTSRRTAPPRKTVPSLRAAPRHVRTWLVEAGLGDVRPSELASLSLALAVVGGAVVYALFGGALPALAAAGLAGTFPLSAARHRRHVRRATAQESWPRMIDEIRILTSSAGRSIPQALIEVGRRAPTELRPAFGAAHREWLLSTDFDRTLAVLKAQLADPTADAACETLLVAHLLGGSDLDARLAALADDRRLDLQGRKDARARQAGVRFARVFVLVVPAGMALAGMAVGDGRAAFSTAGGQLAVILALSIITICWVWASQLMRLPEEERVFGA
jgi:tight adherence protein B